MKKIKTIDVRAKEWFDKVNGNSYFAAIVTVNFGMPDEKRLMVPFEYGYGEQYMQAAFDKLQDEKLVPQGQQLQGFRGYCKENGVILRHYKQTGCLKRELKQLTA